MIAMQRVTSKSQSVAETTPTRARRDRQGIIRRILCRHYSERKKTNPHYSLNAYSKRLGISSGALSEIMRGSRCISHKMGLRLAKTLSLSEEEHKEFLSAFFTHPETKRIAYTVLEIEQYRMISEWYHFAILSLAKLECFESSSTWIALRLGISEKQAQNAIQRLMEQGMLKSENRKWIRTNKRYSTTDGVHSLALREAHRKNLELAAEHLQHTSIEHRDFSSITFAGSPERMGELRELIRSFQDTLSVQSESGKKTEVYRLMTCLFPLTNPSPRRTHD